MTPKLSFITAVVGAALVLAVPAFGDPWGADRSARDGPRLAGPRRPRRGRETTGALEHARRPRALLRREE